MKSLWDLMNSRNDTTRPRPQDDAELAAAASKGDIGTVIRILPRIGTTVNRECPPVGTPLTAAAKHGHTEVVKALLAHPCIDVNRRALGWTALWAAARNDHPEILQLILKHPDANATIAFCGFTALHHAAIGSAARAAGVLLRVRGVDAGAPDRDGCTPLLCAASGPKACVVSLLLRQPGLDFHQTNRYGVSVLQIASGRSRVGTRDSEDETGRSIRTFAVLLRLLRTHIVVDQQQRKTSSGSSINTAEVSVVCKTSQSSVSEVLTLANSMNAKSAAVYRFNGNVTRERQLGRRPGRGKWVPQQEKNLHQQRQLPNHPAIVHVAVVPPRKRWATPPDQLLIRSKGNRATNQRNFAWA